MIGNVFKLGVHGSMSKVGKKYLSRQIGVSMGNKKHMFVVHVTTSKKDIVQANEKKIVAVMTKKEKIVRLDLAHNGQNGVILIPMQKKIGCAGMN